MYVLIATDIDLHRKKQQVTHSTKGAKMIPKFTDILGFRRELGITRPSGDR